MRRLVNFHCKGDLLAATLDEAEATSGLLIISGGNEIRIGAHRGMAKLARYVAAAGFPVFRFDRRGIGDSEGENGGFESSGPDIGEAFAAFRLECPKMKRLVCLGNCDAATALVFNETQANHLILANPWVIEPTDDLPPPAAIKARYLERLRDPQAWLRLFSGAIDIRKAIAGLIRIAKPTAPSSLASNFARLLSSTLLCADRVTILLASLDATAIAFAAEWESEAFAEFRQPGSKVNVVRYNSSSHSFATDADYDVLTSHVIEALSA